MIHGDQGLGTRGSSIKLSAAAESLRWTGWARAGQVAVRVAEFAAAPAFPRNRFCDCSIAHSRIEPGLPARSRRAVSAPDVQRSVDQEGPFLHHGGVMEERLWPR